MARLRMLTLGRDHENKRLRESQTNDSNINRSINQNESVSVETVVVIGLGDTVTYLKSNVCCLSSK